MKKNLSPAERTDLKAELKEILLQEGLAISEAAKLLGISRKTVWAWVNEDGYREQLDNLRIKGIATKRNKESLSAFEAKIRVNFPLDYPLIKQRIDYFRKPNFKTV